MNKLHIYAQDIWHSPATIIGDRATISMLIKTLQEALEKPEEIVHTVEASVSDGEGYDVRIVVLENPDTWRKLKYPYVDPDCDYRDETITL